MKYVHEVEISEIKEIGEICGKLSHAYFYIKYKVLGINKLKKEMQSKFVNEDDLDVMLDSL